MATLIERRYNSFVPIIAPERQIDSSGCSWLCQQGLVDGHMATLESVRGACDVKTPDAIRCFIDKAERFIVVSFQLTEPMPQRQHVMFAQILYVADFEARRFGRGEHDRQWWNVAIGENILFDE